MSEHENLNRGDAIAKLKTIASGEIAMLGTFSAPFSVSCRPMATQAVDDDGTLWFFSGKGSEKNEDIADNSVVSVTYALPNKSEYVSLSGVASIERDQQKIDELWTAWAKPWFGEGPTDPNLTLIRVRPTAGQYWDTKHNRMVQLLGIAVGMVTGQPLDDGVTGSLRLG